MTPRTMLTQHEALTALAVRDHSGTSTQITERAGINDRSVRKNLTKLIRRGLVERVYVIPNIYVWVGSNGDAARYQGILNDLGLLQK